MNVFIGVEVLSDTRSRCALARAKKVRCFFWYNAAHLSDGNGLDQTARLHPEFLQSSDTVAQISGGVNFYLPSTDLSCDLFCVANAERNQAVQDGDTSLKLRNLTFEVPHHEALTHQAHAIHLCFDVASAVVSAPSSPRRPAQIFRRTQRLVVRNSNCGDGLSGFRDRVSLMVGLFAVALAVVDMEDAGATRDSLLGGIEASNTFAYMKAKIVRETIYEAAAATGVGGLTCNRPSVPRQHFIDAVNLMIVGATLPPNSAHSTPASSHRAASACIVSATLPPSRAN